MANSPERLVRNQILLREINERIAEIASSSVGDPPEFLCECSRNDCTETLALSLTEYERVRSSSNLFVILAGHECPDADRVVETRHSHLVEETKHLEHVVSSDRITPAGGVRANG
jgi:hypothetical protein